MEYHSAVKRNEVLTHSVTWITLEHTMLSERSQTYMAKYCKISYL